MTIFSSSRSLILKKNVKVKCECQEKLCLVSISFYDCLIRKIAFHSITLCIKEYFRCPVLHFYGIDKDDIACSISNKTYF